MINDIPDRIRVMCREVGISNKSVLVQIARARDEDEMKEIVRAFASGEMSRDALRKQNAVRPEAKKAGRPKNYVFTLKDKSLPFSLNMTFKKSNVERSEVIDALRALVKRLEA